MKRLVVLLLCAALVFGGALACGPGGPEQPAPKPTMGEATVAPQAGEATLTPTPSLVTLPDGSQIPLPGDAEMVPVVEGFDIGFATSLVEPQLFDFYAAWLSQRGWVLVAPTEAVVSQPHQRWRKDDQELLIELQSPDEQGRTVAWLQVSSLPPQPTAMEVAATPTDKPLVGLALPTAPTAPTGMVGVLATPSAPTTLPTTPPTASVPTTTREGSLWPGAGGWTAKHGGPDGARANASARLRLPLALAWEWGGGENNPAAVAIAGGKVFLLTSQGQLCILDADTGTERMCYFLWPDEQSPASTEGLVAVNGDTVVVSAMEVYIKPGEHYSSIRSRLAAFSLDGQPRWALPPAEDQSGNAIVPGQGLVVSVSSAGPGDFWMTAFDTTSGAERWRVPGFFVQGASDGTNLYTESTSAFRLSTGEQLWEQKTDAKYLAYAGGRLYTAGDHALTCLDAGTGQAVWQTGFGAFLSGPDSVGIVVAHGHVYLKPEIGATHHGYRSGVMALDAATGQERWSALTEENMAADSLAATADSVVVVGTDYDTFTNLLLVLDAASGAELDRVALGDFGGGLAVAEEQVYVLGPTLRVYGPGQPGAYAPQPTPTLPPPTAATPVPTAPLPPTPPGGAALPTGRYAQMWERFGKAEGPLGWGLDPAVEGFYAIQRFEHGLMHWGRQDRMGDPENEVQIILYGPGDNRQAGQEWYRYTDYWREGDEEYPCPQAGPPWGPRRGFGKVWCECEYCRDHLGAPVEEEWGEQGGYQDFQGGTMLWSPKDGGIYVLLHRGDWRFEPVE